MERLAAQGATVNAELEVLPFDKAKWEPLEELVLNSELKSSMEAYFVTLTKTSIKSFAVVIQ